jgi:hypothetical protein
MDIFDKMCFTVSSAGGRRGAQMATFDIAHPDVTDFIKAKRGARRYTAFPKSSGLPPPLKRIKDSIARLNKQDSRQENERLFVSP